MQNKIKILKRLGILAILLCCLGFVSMEVNTAQAVMMQPCCNDCPVDPFDPNAPTPEDYCAAYCGPTGTHTCYNNCLTSVYNCWAHCSPGCP